MAVFGNGFNWLFKPEALSAVWKPGDYRLVAIAKHGDQKYDIYHYSYHLAFVETTLSYHGYDSYEYLAAGWLHDIVEDTDTTVDQISHLFGEAVAGYVWACTGEGDNRKERADSIYKKLRKIPEAAPVKVADRYANVRYGIISRNIDKLEMYVKEHDTFSDNIRPLMIGSKASLLWNDLESMIEHAKDLIKCQHKVIPQAQAVSVS